MKEQTITIRTVHRPSRSFKYKTLRYQNLSEAEFAEKVAFAKRKKNAGIWTITKTTPDNPRTITVED